MVGAAVVAGMAPDLDALSLFWGAGYYTRYHQTLTHNLFVVPLLVLSVAYCFYRYSPCHRFPALIGVSVLGGFMHLLLDLTIAWGLAPFWPVSSRTWCLALIHLTDPLFLFLCGGACYLVFRLPYWHLRRRIALILFPSLAIYLLARYLFFAPR